MEIIFVVILSIVLLYFIMDRIFNKNHTKKKKYNKRKHSNEKYHLPMTELPYQQKYLLTKTEYKFWNELKNYCKTKDYIICPKVRLEDFITVSKDKSDNIEKYRNHIKSRHVDFIICNNNLNILAGIELDDYSHNTDKAKEIDIFKDNVFKTIKIPLYRIKVGEQYLEQLEQTLGSLIEE